ncbi:MAG: lipopolysaccharide transport periplasmic protein LptA [Deltaproteobacteria bacterium]|nr:lipopolysaccharide transport periplasmic protein LptA [Deltaproteobacteria bacterium]
MQTLTRLLPLVMFFAFTFLPLLQARGEEETAGVTPIQIEADRMETSRQGGRVVFTGNITARQGSLAIYADKMTVVYAAASPGAGTAAEGEMKLISKIEKLEARGNVKIVQEGWIATGDSMDYNAADRVATLTGNARAWQDKNVVSGETIVLYLDEGKSVVQKSSREGERVKALIYPSGAEKSGGAR